MSHPAGPAGQLHEIILCVDVRELPLSVFFTTKEGADRWLVQHHITLQHIVKAILQTDAFSMKSRRVK